VNIARWFSYTRALEQQIQELKQALAIKELENRNLLDRLMLRIGTTPIYQQPTHRTQPLESAIPYERALQEARDKLEMQKQEILRQYREQHKDGFGH